MREKVSMVLILIFMFSAIHGTFFITSVVADSQNDSAEIVIGINGARSDAYAKLMSFITESNGRLINTVSFREKLGAIVADVPFESVSSFVGKVRSTRGLARYVEPNMKFSATFTPNDPNWTVQWGPRKVEAHYAWNTTTGNRSILVAVIDTGIDWNHPDLAANYVPGDINHDGHVNGADGVLLGKAWGSKPGDPNWNPHADLNEDAIIDEKDKNILSKHWYKGAYDTGIDPPDFETVWRIICILLGING